MVGEVIARRYALEELVGTGGMSSVYRAHDTLLERDVALKILHDSQLADPESIERFRREARAAAQLSHPNLVTVIDRGEADGCQFIVFEYVDGETLKELVTRTGALSVERALGLAIQVGRALAYAHRHGIVHRDVKPQNVLVDADGRAKVADFGIARSLAGERAVTLTGTVLGTSHYVSPEQASGRRADAASDVYSLGVVLFELLTGEVPFPGESFVEVAMRHVREPAPDVRTRRATVPPRAAAAVAKALAKEPADRFPSMEAFVAELEECLAGGAAPTEAETTAVRPPRASTRARRRPRWPVAALALGVALLGVAVGLAFVFVDGGPGATGGLGGDEGPAATPVRLTAVSSWDPEGDDQTEHPDDVPKATDRDSATFWTTSRYRASLVAIGKSGVGIVLDAGREAEPARITVTTDTPGFTAEIRAGASATGPFEARVSPPRVVGGSTVFPVEGPASRYYLVWITKLDGFAHLNEVTAR